MLVEKIIKDLYETEIPSLFLKNFTNKYEENNIYKDKKFYNTKRGMLDFIFLFRSSNEEFFTSSLYVEKKLKCLNILNDIYSRLIRNSYLKLNNTKTKGEVNHSNKKLWKQKGTGRARIGSGNSSILRGGGIIFGPKFNNIKLKINKKIKKKLINNVFFLQKTKLKIISQNNNISSFFKTKEILTYLNLNNCNLKNNNKKILILSSNNITDKISNKLSLLLNNVSNIKIIKINNINIRHFLMSNEIYILEHTINELLQYLMK